VRRPTRPAGQPTRGKTALNRLRQIDVYIALAHSEVLMGGAPLVVDIGFGAYAWTTLEMRDRWLPLNFRLKIVGVEIDPERVVAAQPYAVPPLIDFRLGGFNLAALCGRRTVRLIRCFNVLRQYDPGGVAPALADMAEALEMGGLLIEGTSNPTGRIVAFDVYCQREEGLRHEALVFGTNFRSEVQPEDFQAILPKRLIHEALAPRPAAFFRVWQQALQRARGIGLTGRRQWIDAALRLRADYPIDIRLRIIRRGFLVLRDSLIPTQ